MSVDISWDTITHGEDGAALAAQIRDFIHDKFQQVPLPRFIKSVHVHSFAFGSACPDVEIKDISDPLPDFYEDDASDDSNPDVETMQTPGQPHTGPAQLPAPVGPIRNSLLSAVPPSSSPTQDLHARLDRDQGRALPNDFFSEPLPRSGTPGIPGGTSNFSYFHHLPMSGLSGTHTPLAAVASGTPFSPMSWHHDLPHATMLREPNRHGATHVDAHDLSTRPSTATTLITSPDLDPSSHSSSPDRVPFEYRKVEKVSDDPTAELCSSGTSPLGSHQSQPSDMQVVARVKYSGDVRVMLTAEILLDYPMPSFVGIPLQLSITGITFDGTAVLAYIRNRMHFCFLDPEDAETLVGDASSHEQKQGANSRDRPNLSADALIKDIHIETEIGRQESGKQGLKNVGKVEKFVLEQIRKIFDDEFVFPSFWTFLV